MVFIACSFVHMVLSLNSRCTQGGAEIKTLNFMEKVDLRFFNVHIFVIPGPSVITNKILAFVTRNHEKARQNCTGKALFLLPLVRVLFH